MRSYLGTTDNSGVELKFRGELEFLITKMFEKDGVPILGLSFSFLNTIRLNLSFNGLRCE